MYELYGLLLRCSAKTSIPTIKGIHFRLREISPRWACPLIRREWMLHRIWCLWCGRTTECIEEILGVWLRMSCLIWWRKTSPLLLLGLSCKTRKSCIKSYWLSNLLIWYWFFVFLLLRLYIGLLWLLWRRLLSRSVTLLRLNFLLQPHKLLNWDVTVKLLNFRCIFFILFHLLFENFFSVLYFLSLRLKYFIINTFKGIECMLLKLIKIFSISNIEGLSLGLGVSMSLIRSCSFSLYVEVFGIWYVALTIASFWLS